MRRGPCIINTCSGTSSWQLGINNDFYRPGCFANTRRSRKKTKKLLVPIRFAGESLSFFDAEVIASGTVLAIHPPTWLFYWRAYTRCVSLCMSFPTGFNLLHELCTIRPDTVQPRRRRGNQCPQIPTSFTIRNFSRMSRITRCRSKLTSRRWARRKLT